MHCLEYFTFSQIKYNSSRYIILIICCDFHYSIIVFTCILYHYKYVLRNHLRYECVHFVVPFITLVFIPVFPYACWISREIC